MPSALMDGWPVQSSFRRTHSSTSDRIATHLWRPARLGRTVVLAGASRCLRADACASSHVAYSAELEGSVWNRVRPSTLPFALLQLVDLDCSSTACPPVQFRHLAFRIDKSLSWS